MPLNLPDPPSETTVGSEDDVAAWIEAFRSFAESLVFELEKFGREASTLSPIVAGALSGDFSAHANWLSETNPGDFASALYTSSGGVQTSGYWPGNGSTYLGISARISGADDPPNADGAITADDAPRNGLTVVLTDNGSVKDAVAIMGLGIANAASTQMWGGNFIAQSSQRFSDTVKLVGLEVDVQFAAGAGTIANPGGAGIYVNLFNNTSGGPVLQCAASPTASSRWTNGIILSQIGTTGAGLAMASTTTLGPGWLVNTTLPGGINYADSAIFLPGNNGTNGQAIKFTGSSGSHVSTISMSTTDNFTVVYDSNLFIQHSGNTAMNLTLTTGLPAATSSLSIWARNTAGSGLLAVTLGAVDSGGVGFRALRVPN